MLIPGVSHIESPHLLSEAGPAEPQPGFAAHRALGALVQMISATARAGSCSLLPAMLSQSALTEGHLMRQEKDRCHHSLLLSLSIWSVVPAVKSSSPEQRINLLMKDKQKALLQRVLEGAACRRGR